MDGDCLNSGSNNNCGADTNNSTVNKQSPASGTAAKAYQVYTQGVQNPIGQPVAPVYQISQKPKFITIYNQRDLKFDLSDDLSILIRYSPLNGRTNQYTYKRVVSPARICEFERHGYRWIAQKIDFSHEYFVLRQVDIEYNRYTGVVKIVKMTNAIVKQWATTRIEANPGDWIYYEKG